MKKTRTGKFCKTLSAITAAMLLLSLAGCAGDEESSSAEESSSSTESSSSAESSSSSTTSLKVEEIAGVPIESTQSSEYKPPEQLDITSSSSSSEAKKPEVIDLTPVENKPLNINWGQLKSANPDIRGWIKLTGTTINNPIVQSDDNTYYLTHDFYGNEDVHGTIYSSWANTWDDTDDNRILFGHNMYDGTMMAYVTHYVPNDVSSEPLAFYKVHPTLLVATPDGAEQTYKIFAGVLINTQSEHGEVFEFAGRTHFSSREAFNEFILGIMERSWFYTDVDLTYGDDLLTLCTCWWPLGRDIDTRWVVFARRVRPGESKDVDTSVAVRNYKAHLFDTFYKKKGGSWNGKSAWDTSKLLSL